jgi:signal recognition particle receptor subunit beta
MHVVATAGHVDHGKSTLVRALTGMEPDRWAEERRRGLTIDLGFAWLTLPGGERLSFVDVPGHERFVPNMLAGVGPVPAVLFVVAADGGWMPQSAEHLAAIDALGISRGVLAVSRADLADPGPATRRAIGEIGRTSLGRLPSVAVSAVTGQGLPELRSALAELAAGLPAPDPAAPVRLWVDRVFSMTGSGTVVTGTLPAGTVRAGGELLLTVDRVDVAQASALLDRIGVIAETSLLASTAHPAQPLDPGNRVHDVPVTVGALAWSPGPDAVPLLQTDGHTVMVGARVGAGRAYVLGSPYPLSNSGLRADGPQRSDAYALVLAVLERARGGRIGFDEVHHGEGNPATGAAAILDGPIGVAGGLAAAVVFAYLLLSGRRLGGAVPAGDPSRVPSAGDFVTDMARLYERSRIRGAVAWRYAEELKQRVGAAAGLEPGLDDDTFVQRISGHGAERAAEVRDALRRARDLSSGQPDDRQVLSLAQLVDDVERRW